MSSNISKLLRVQCCGLQLQPSLLRLGLLHSLLQLATGPQTAKHEKRRIRLAQSAYFELNGKPNSNLFEYISQSEVLEDSVDISSQILFEVICPEHMDCRIRLNVYYSSNLTSGREIVLGI